MKHRGAFSLLELLVVIAVITVLAALLLPVVTAARRRAQAAACASNLNQIGLSLQMYRTANSDFIPAMLFSDASVIEQRAGFMPEWISGTAHAASDKKGFTEFCDPAVLCCPAMGGYERASYGVNGRVVTAGHSYYMRENVSELPLVFDARDQVGYYYSDLDFRHMGDAQVLFADYHVEPKYVASVDLATGAGQAGEGSGVDGFNSATPLPGPQSFTLQGGVVTTSKRLRATITAIGAGYVGWTPIRAYYRLNGGSTVLVSENARYGGTSVTIDDLVEDDTITIASSLMGGAAYESDDGSGHVWSLVRGDTVPSLTGYQGQASIADFLTEYIDAEGRVTISENAVIYLFEHSSSINYQRDSWADFQDCVVLVEFENVTQ